MTSEATPKIQRDVGYFELFRYATTWDYVLIVVALISAFLKSLVHPIAIIVYSELIGLFIERNLGIGTTSTTYALPLFGGGVILENATHAENMAELKRDSWAFGILISLDSLLMFLTGIIYVDLFNRVALRLVVRMRRKYFEATIRQDISWHDVSQQHNFALHITDNMEKIRNGIAENVGHFVQLVFDVVISIAISFAYGWKLTLAICIYIPITVCINVIVAKFQSKLTAREQISYGLAGSIAEEVMGAIRTVLAFGGERSESERFDRLLVPARKAGKLKGVCTGLSDSVLKSMLFISSACAFWYATHLIMDDRYKEPEDREYTATIMMIVIAGIIVGADHIARSTPFLEAFATARGAAAAIFEVIETETKIDPLAKDGKILNYGVQGRLEFQDIFFRYPARDDAIVLRGLNLSIAEGATVALVGHSGSGKSTCIQLLQRFYDPIFGRVLLDDVDIRNYNVSWLRSTMAVVGQESVLFQGTIGENIRHGKPDATQKEVEDAAKAANAHDFIIALSNSYGTMISEKGVQLSGGQRQRIAIARALIQNPKILLLDEATSALDYHSEKLVQQALDRASKGRTTLVVSHRLSAIRYAERIVYLDKGRIVEDGTHEQLMQLGGKYYEMVTAHQYDGDAEQLFNEIEEEEELQPTRKYSNSDFDKTTPDAKHLAPRLSKASLEKNALSADGYANGDANIANEEEPKADDISYMRTFIRIIRSAKPEWCFLILATICAGLYGCSHPAFSIIYANMYGAFTDQDEDKVYQRTGELTIVCVVTGIAIGIVCFIQTYFFNVSGVWLTTRMRSLTFQAIMRQNVGWFDLPSNSVGALSARLAGDASGVQGAIGFPLSNIIQAITNFICSVSIAFYYSWELALICLCTSPFMVVSIVFEAKFMTKSALEEKMVLEETSRIATEATAQIRTVAALRREAALIEAYGHEVDRYEMQIRHKLRFRGLVNSLGMAIMFFGYAVTLTYGGIMNAEGRIDFADIMTISNTMLYGLFLLAQSLAFTPAFNAAIISANRIYRIHDRQSPIQSPPCTLMVPPTFESSALALAGKNNVVQGVSLRNVHFRYPTRRHQPVLRGLDLEVLQGKTVALVGASGSGKSTCVQLLLRYYDPDAGNILIDSYDIHRDLSLSALRQCMGIVSQEPSLFEKTIAENIAYGAVHRTVPIAEVIAAAKTANAHDFITALSNGYDTRLGAKGTQLSGGQKQRIAIARALVRNPKILLLDEATSALDLQSERVVQSALDKACSGRTCIVIAHRLATVQKADEICVLQHGRIIEQGNHPTLLAKNGLYAKLYRSQPNT